jgi:hypothetical protein
LGIPFNKKPNNIIGYPLFRNGTVFGGQVNDSSYGFGQIIVDDNGSVNRIVNQKWTLTQAVELNDEIYALASSSAGELQGDVYLITTVSESAVEALVDINPDSLNKNSKGQWVTVYITLPAGYDVARIDVSTIEITSLTGTSCQPDYHQPADLSFIPQVGDRDEDGIPDLTVKFNRQELIANLCLDDVAITVEGELFSGEHFKGIDHIRVIDRGK